MLPSTQAHPGLLAPASLKRVVLIETPYHVGKPHPGLLAPASLKPFGDSGKLLEISTLIRGFLPRPH